MTGLTAAAEPARVLEDLAELKRLTADEHGAQRLAWTDGWRAARRFLEERLAGLGVSPRVDPAGNLWAESAGDRPGLVVVGSHLDSVPDGGDLDGALGVLAGLELLRAASDCREERRSIALVDFADEEGARFGHSLFGSTALVGTLDPAIGALRDGQGRALADVVAEHGVSVADANDAAAELQRVSAYVELHIEQGRELVDSTLPVAAVSGATGIERFAVTLTGQATHAGATAMAGRRDPFLTLADAASELAPHVAAHDGLITIGHVAVSPNVATTVPHSVTATVDLRHPESERLAELTDTACATFVRIAGRRGCEARVQSLWRMAPRRFDDGLVAAASRAAASVGGATQPMLSGRGHDAIVVARRVPVVMLFAPSIDGVSHSRDERTDEADLTASIRALATLVDDLVTFEPEPWRTG